MSALVDADQQAEARREELLLQAFLGYSLDLKRGRVIIKACAWCPGKSYVEEWAAAHDSPVSHGCCPRCSAKLIAQITGDQSEEIYEQPAS